MDEKTERKYWDGAIIPIFDELGIKANTNQLSRIGQLLARANQILDKEKKKADKRFTSYQEKLNYYASLIDREKLKNAIIYVSTQKCDTTTVYTQKVESDRFLGDIEIHVSLRNKMWEHQIFYNRNYFNDFTQALLIVRDDIHRELGWVA